MNFPTIKSRNTAKRVARFGWPTRLSGGRCHREPAMQPFRRSTAAPYASPLFCRSAGWGQFFCLLTEANARGTVWRFRFLYPGRQQRATVKNAYRVCNCPRRGLFLCPPSGRKYALSRRMRCGRAEGKECRAEGARLGGCGAAGWKGYGWAERKECRAEGARVGRKGKNAGRKGKSAGRGGKAKAAG